MARRFFWALLGVACLPVACGKAQFGGGDMVRTGVRPTARPNGEGLPGMNSATSSGQGGASVDGGSTGQGSQGNGGGGSTGANAAAAIGLQMVCPGNPLQASLQRQVKLVEGQQVVLRGDVCLTQSVSHVVADFVFVVDTSGSMGSSDPGCRRRDAVNAVLNKISGSMHAGDDVRVGFVKFNSRADIVSYLEPLSAAMARASNPDFCEQSGNTNYEAALDKARQVLATSGARQKVVYFLSDGMPTTDNSSGSPQENGERKANELHALGNLRMLSIFLNAGGIGGDAGYLAKISQGGNNVKMVENADSLVTEIVKFEIPAAPGLLPGDVVVTLSAPGLPSVQIPVVSVKQKDANGLAWSFETQNFWMLRGAANPTPNTLTLQVSKPGVGHQAVSEIFEVAFP